MSTRTPEWHAVAQRLYAEGVHLGEIARRMRKPRSTVSWAVDASNTRERHRERVRTQRQAIGTTHRVERRPTPVVAAVAPQIEINRKPTLPHISISPIEEPAPVRKFAPRTRWSSKPGVDRIRAIHLKMIRDGRVAAPDLVSEWRQ